MKNNDVSFFLGLFFVSIIVSYFLPAILGRLYYLVLLISFISAKRESNHKWIVFFWFLYSFPGYLFAVSGSYSLPSLSFPGLGREMLFEEIFAIITVLKSYFFPVKQEVFYKKYVFVLIAYAIFLLYYGALQGSTLIIVLKSIRYFIPLLLLLSLPRLVPYSLVPRTINLMFVSVFILVGAQFFELLAGKPIAALLGESQFSFSGREVDADFKVFDVTEGVVRTVYGPFILLISLFLSLSLMVNRNRGIFNNKYLILITIISAFSIFMSATRGWIVGVVIVFIGFVFIGSTKFAKMIVATLMFLLIAMAIPKINMQISHSLDRVLTMETLAKGDLTAGGTSSRFKERGPRVMKKFYESPVFGFGFSPEFYEYQDGHVGHQNLLLNGGIIGFGIYSIFLYLLGRRYYSVYKFQRNRIGIIFMFGLLSIMAIHSSSAMIFGYSLHVQTAIALSMFFFFSDYFLYHSRTIKYENNTY